MKSPPVKIWFLGEPRRSSGVPGSVALGLRPLLSFLLAWLLPGRARAEDHVDYRYEYYGEENGRIRVDTQSVLFEKKLTEAIRAQGEFVYDSISGASPIGKPNVQLYEMRDTRYAGNLELDLHWGAHTLSPQFAYSSESDYQSLGLAFNDAIEFNQKNTTLRWGVAHNFDHVQPVSWSEAKDKDTTDALLGFSQLLGPKTILTADFTFGYDTGYLDDPYKKIVFSGWGDPNAIFDEHRPGYRSREVLLLTLTQCVTPLNGSADISYRFYHDSFDIFSHTAALTWHQWLGKHLIVEPTLRFYTQSAADFYYLSVPGLLPSIPDPERPPYYSADYRLSNLMTFDYGLQANIILHERVHLNVGYRRYEMYGLDGVTPSANYPKANVITAGLRLWF
jgi:hypothetical protein